jgi:hypothetical protein
MSWILSWSRKAEQKHGMVGYWNANTRDAVLKGSGLTLWQYWAARDHLTEICAAEITVHSFAGKRMVFTRPTYGFLRIWRNDVTICLATGIR